MENDERRAMGAVTPELSAPPALIGEFTELPTPLQSGRTPVWRLPQGILRAGPRRTLEAQVRGAQALREAFPSLAAQAPAPLAPICEHQGRHWLLEEDQGPEHPAPEEQVHRWVRGFLDDRSEPMPLAGTLRALLRTLEPAGLPRSSRLVAALRKARSDGAALPFAPRQAVLERALAGTLELELTRTWSHGAITPTRVLTDGGCHWRHFGPDGFLGEDMAAFAELDSDDPTGALLALRWGWRHDAVRAADALVALGMVPPSPPRWVELELAQPHPCLRSGDLERLLGVAPGRVPATAAARALGRVRGLTVGGLPVSLRVTPPVSPRRSADAWRIRGRDPQRLFSRWHEGIRMDPVARASVSPEASALDTARRMGAATIVDAFCGAGGNAIAFARMPWCTQVIALDTDPRRLDQARHNAGIYGVQDRIRFVLGDFFEQVPALAEAGADACFLDPPWDAGADMATRAWRAARGSFPRGAMKQPRQLPLPTDADDAEVVFGVGPIISWVQAWWGA